MEHQATSGNFGAGTTGMTLQAGRLRRPRRPGQHGHGSRDPDPAANSDIDTAVFRGARAEYDITNNGTIITVNHARPAVANNADGIDTLTNIEQLQFTDTLLLTSGVAITDTTAPSSVIVTGPAAAATVSGTVTLSATAVDNIGVTGVQFLVDGVSVGPEDTSAPFSASFDSTRWPTARTS